MAVATKGNEGKDPMADDDKSGEISPPRAKNREEREERSARQAASVAHPGFFTLYKPGQGYWTRMGTAGGAVLIIALVGQWLYGRLLASSIGSHLNEKGVSIPGPSAGAAAGIVLGLIAVIALVLWRYLNKPAVVDFFIATESEMKKVNWTTRKELIGSTKVVIAFMFIIAVLLFLIDMFFGYFFHILRVLKYPPF